MISKDYLGVTLVLRYTKESDPTAVCALRISKKVSGFYGKRYKNIVLPHTMNKTMFLYLIRNINLFRKRFHC